MAEKVQTKVKKYSKGVVSGVMGAGFLVAVLSIFTAGATLKLMSKFGVTRKIAKFVTEGYGV